MIRKYLVFILSFVVLAGSAQKSLTGNQAPKVDYYISVTGNDSNSGSIEKPFRTLEKAQSSVRLLLKNDHRQDITVYLRGGNYFVANTLRFDERDGSKNIRVNYRGFKNEKAIIIGGVAVTGWNKLRDNIYGAPVPLRLKGKPFYRLYDDSRSAVSARYPNLGSGFGNGLVKINNTTVKVPEGWRNYDFTNAQVYGWLGLDWFSELRAARSFDKEQLQLTIDPGADGRMGLNDRIYIQGVPELLDEENEWCLKNDSVYYFPSDKSDINKRLIIAPTVPRVIEIKGSSASQLIENISFENLHFQGSDFVNSWEIFHAGEDNMIPAHLQEGLIFIENAKNIQVKYCEIKGAGHSAVFINNLSESCTVYGCALSDAGFCGIYVNSYVPADRRFSNAQASYINKKHNLSNNFIHHCGLSIGTGSGIVLYQSGENRITHNVICDMPRFGISYSGIRDGVLNGRPVAGEKINYVNHFDYVHTRNNYIAYNDIFNVCRSSLDFGAIQSWGPGRDNVWDCNAIHDVDQAVRWDAWAHGLFTDDGSDFVTLKNNVVFELKGGKLTGAVMVKSVNEEVINNVFADNTIGRAITMAPFIEPSMNNVVHKNIVFQSGEMLYAVNRNSLGKDFYGRKKNDFNKEYVRDQKVFKKVDFNLIYPSYQQLDSLKKYGWDVNSIVADPLFDKKHEQWDITYSDYKLKPESPAFQLGFTPILFDSIGLLKDFPFERKIVKSAGLKFQAEDYSRMKGLRGMGATGINRMEKGAWAKYNDVDFGEGLFGRFVFNLNEAESDKTQKCLFEIRLDSPLGELIGTVNRGDNQVTITKVNGIHNLFLVFRNEVMLDSFRFIQSQKFAQ
jgi:hypothetical protein